MLKPIHYVLKIARVKQNLKQKDIWQALGVHYSTFSQYENGQRKIPHELFVRWCLFLGLEIKDFVDEGVSKVVEW